MTESIARDEAVILSSGGADGAYSVGVMKALLSGQCGSTEYQPLDPGVFSGSSIGAFNAAFMVSHLGEGCQKAMLDLERIWLDELSDNPDHCDNGAYRFRADPAEVLDPLCFGADPLNALRKAVGDGVYLSRDMFSRARRLLASSAPLAQRILEMFNLSSFVDDHHFAEIIRRKIHFENIRSSSRPLRVFVTNWDTGEVEVFNNEGMTDQFGPLIIRASGAIPGFFRPVEIDETAYVDGGLLAFARLGPAIRAGADVLHVIYLDPHIRDVPTATLQSTFCTLYRIFLITWAAQINGSIEQVKRLNREVEDGTLPEGRDSKEYKKVTVHRYRPHSDLGGPIGFFNLNPERIKRLIKQGYDDTVLHNCKQSGCVLL